MPRVIIVLGVLFGCAAMASLAHTQRVIAIAKQDQNASLEEPSAVIHPTVVPFKYDRQQCETSHRQWKDGQCFDYDHDHTF